jgi:fatty acid elongase 3
MSRESVLEITAKLAATNPELFWTSGIYLAVIICWVAVKRFPVGFLQLHYMGLTIFSLVCFVGVVLAAVEKINSSGFDSTMCVTKSQSLDPNLLFWFKAFHYSKFWEIVDTIIILAKGRPLTFLHVFHHALVVIQSYTWVSGELSFTWIGVAFNTFVHVFMYYFYFVGASGGRVSWRSRITQLQIFQFTFSLGVYGYFVAVHLRAVAVDGVGCKGWVESFFSIFFNTALLFLFARLARQKSKAD